MSVIGENIKKRREALGMSQNRLAKSAGIGQSTLSSIESDTKSPVIDTIILLSKVLGCTVSELIGEADLAAEQARSADELELLAIFRQLTPMGKAIMINQASGLLAEPGLRQAGSIASEG